MEYLFGFVFTLLKIALQAAIYATLLRWLARQADTWHLNNTLVRASRNSKQFWRRSFMVAYGSLFLFSCTYWGNHGLGDSEYIPVGHGETVEEINGMVASFAPLQLPSGAPIVSRFEVGSGVLCGQAADSSYFAYDLVTKQQRLFADDQEYADYASQHSLPTSGELTSFRTQYARYWNGWRCWLLA